MVLLPDHEILAAVESGHVGVDPWDPSLVQPASLDLRLGEEFYTRVRQDWYPLGADLTQPLSMQEIHHRGPLDLLPGQLVLAHTLEAVRIPADIACRVEGKSSWGRLGLVIHTTAGWVDPGFAGSITLELFNVSQENIPLVPGEPIGQLSFMRLTSPAARPYGSPGVGHYQYQAGATPSRFATTHTQESTA